MNPFALLRNALRPACLFVALGILGFVGGSANAQTQPAIFPVVPQITFPADAFNVFAGDINGDGTPDLAYFTLTSSATTLGVLLNVGSNAPTTVTTNLCPGSSGIPQVNFADLNNDKKLDLVFFCNGYLTIQLGNGDGTFQAPAYFAGYSGMPVFADFNGDGYMDIATLGGPANTVPQVSIYLNHGSSGPGTFASPKLYPAANSTGLQAGDFNGDGKADLLTAVYSSLPFSGAVSVFYGNGDGTLNPAKSQSTATFSSFTVGDFNGDGVTDVALLPLSAADSLYGSVQILLGSTSGTFTPGAAIPLLATTATVSGYGTAMTAAALTADGNLDLVVTTSVVTIFHGDGKGNFTPTGSYGPGYLGNPLLFADVNGDGKQDMIAGNPAYAYIFAGNGDGTFQAPPATPVYGPIADVNNDGIADILFFPPQNSFNMIGTALGRGDGTFAILNQTIPLPASPRGFALMVGDFNGDGKIDTLAIQPGTQPISAFACADQNDSQLLTFLGNGDGTFQEKGTGQALGVVNPAAGITGDFNSDGKLDLILPYNLLCQAGLVFLPGNGDGTFGAPVPLNVSQSSSNPGLFAGDLNNDKKLDFIWGNAVFLGNGDGTFKQIPLSIDPSPVIALTDLNGDGSLDAVSNPGIVIYAGKGDGTFQTSPFFNLPNLNPNFFASGSVNGNADPDLLPVAQTVNWANPVLTPYLGDGHGNFTQDTNTYLVGMRQLSAIAPVPVRLNNQAPVLANDYKLDLLTTVTDVSSDTYTVSLLNQTNPVPTKPAPLTSTTALQSSLATAPPGAAITLTASVFGTNPTGSISFTANGNALGTEAVVNGTATLPTSFANTGSYSVTAAYTGDGNNTASTSSAVSITITPATSATTLQATPGAGNVNGQITLKASVSGDSPTGSVSFAAGTTSLGTATVTNGVATLQTSFSTAGSYATTATYRGDQNNAASTSSAVTIVIAAPDFTVTATPTSGSITPGQTATFTFSVTPVAGYAGTLKFSCGPLPAQAACSFSPASATPSGGSPASSTLTVTTAAATAALNLNQRSAPSLPPWIPAGGLAVAGAMGIAFAPRKIQRWNRQLRLLSWGLVLASISLSVLGCGGSNSSPSTPATTPAGSYTISVNVTDSGGGPQHSVSVALVVQ